MGMSMDWERTIRGIKPLVSLVSGVPFETSETKHPFKKSLI